MKGTACEKCLKMSFWDKVTGKKPCPNLTKSWWKNGQTGEMQEVIDCAPKRTMLMSQELHNQVITLQRALEETRNELVNVQLQLAHYVQDKALESPPSTEDLNLLDVQPAIQLAQDEHKQLSKLPNR